MFNPPIVSVFAPEPSSHVTSTDVTVFPPRFVIVPSIETFDPIVPIVGVEMEDKAILSPGNVP